LRLQSPKVLLDEARLLRALEEKYGLHSV
jgi:hypothetical protein